jgi:hypothetical protein
MVQKIGEKKARGKRQEARGSGFSPIQSVLSQSSIAKVPKFETGGGASPGAFLGRAKERGPTRTDEDRGVGGPLTAGVGGT